MTRLLILSPEKIRPVMAGVGIRCTEISKYLASLPDIDVTLAIPNQPDPTLAQEIDLVQYSEANLATLVSRADVVLLHAHVSNLYFAAVPCDLARPLVVDLYDPFPIENLNYFPTLGDQPFRHDRMTIRHQLEQGDLFLCSSNEQRLFYLGLLYALGRLNPETYFEDFELSNLVRIVPFGLPSDLPPPGDSIIRTAANGIGKSDPVIFFGGIYEWYDPMLLIEALPSLLERFDNLRVVFSANPNLESTPQGTYARVLDQCRQHDWLDSHVFFLPWVPFERRTDLYREATLGVVLHHPRFETELSMRTRIQDFLWAGLPTIATVGGGMSRLLEEHQMGRVIPHHDREALIRSMSDLLESDQSRAHLIERGQAWARDNTWDAVLAPLVDFVREPRIDPVKSRYAESRPIKAEASTFMQGLTRKLEKLRRQKN